MQKKQPHVLIIEPDKLLARAYALALEEVGYSTAVAHGSQEAVEQADGHRPDVVLLELSLPRHDGVEFLYEFRSYDEWADVPVVVVSSLPPERLEKVKPVLTGDLGVKRMLYKPAASLETILRAIKGAVRFSQEAE